MLQEQLLEQRAQLSEAAALDSWLTRLARERQQPRAAVLALFDDDPQALADEIAALRVEDAYAAARELVRLGTERPRLMRKLRRSERFDDRLTLRLYERMPKG